MYIYRKGVIDLINIINPYTPGSGRVPSFIAGRDAILEEARRHILSTQAKYPERSIAYYGLRGVGKTVLLNTIENISDDLCVLNEHIEIKEKNVFIKDISIAAQKMLNQMSLKEVAKDKLTKALNAIKKLKITINPQDKTLTAELTDIDTHDSLSSDITELLVCLGKIALDTNNTICLFIDEIQYIEDEQLEALLMALHRVNQLRLPVLIFCAGLPKILKTFGDIKSYSERLFKYTQIDSLKEYDATNAIVKPAKDFNVEYDENAVSKILSVTKCYPYFIQELCSTIWLTQSTDTIRLEHVVSSMPHYLENLDRSFFQIRFERCTELEKDFMYSMVRCGELPCTIANVANIMGRSVKSISPIRGQLINKGLIYSTGHGEIDFTVPQFDEFLKRVNPELQ